MANKHLVAACLLLAAGCIDEDDSALGSDQLALESPVVVYIIAGQSNAVGGASIYDLSPPLAEFGSSVDMPYAQELGAPKNFGGGAPQISTGWLTQVAPRNRERFGIELSAGRRLIERYGADVALLKHATNGSNLFRDWDTGTTNSLWQYMTTYVDARLAELPDGSYVGGLFWVQGSADANSTAERSADYAENLSWFISHFRAKYGPVPVVADRLPTFFELDYGDVVRRAQIDVASVLDDVYLVDTSDLGPARDVPGAHYRADAFVALGTRMVDALPAPSYRSAAAP
jgi:hypothetical protein